MHCKRFGSVLAGNREGGYLFSDVLLTRLVHVQGKGPWCAPYLSPRDCLVVKLRLGSDFDLELIIHFEVTSVHMVDGDVYLCHLDRDMLYNRVWVHGPGHDACSVHAEEIQSED